MQLKKLNNWLTRVLLICLFALVYIGGYCEKPRPINPNLRFLVGDTLNSSIHCHHPVVSPDGNVVYYLRANSDSVEFDELTFGAIYSVNVDGTGNKEVLYGKYNALAISPDGKKLAVHPLCGSLHNLEPESLMIIYHLSDEKCDTYSTVRKRIWDIEFATDTQWVYYSADAGTSNYNRTEFYRVNLSDSVNELLKTVDYGIGGFDLTSGDSVYFDLNIAYPQINPIYQKYAIGTPECEDLKFVLKNIATHKLDTLPSSLVPYNGNVGYPYWFPNGKDIVFMAKPYNEPANTIAGEIWILTNFFDQIDTTNLK